MEKVYKFVKDPSYVGKLDNTFTHYWNNSSINFFDSLSTEEYLAKYYPNYHWEEDDTLGINKTNIAYATVTIANWPEPVIFVKFEDEDGSEIPTYYYGTNANSQTTPTENATHTVYQLELDLWATIGWRFNKWLKEDFTQDVMCFRRMCDRFIFNSYLGYSLNYQLQPYLMQTARYAYPLIKNPDERSLTLNEWLYINSGEQRYKTLESWSVEWYKWLQQPWAAPIYVSGNWPGVQGTTEWLNYYQNNEGRFLPNGFNDSDYNSNGKYKWFVIKTGNNSNVENAHNPVFPNINDNGGIPIKKGTGNTPFFTIPANTFTYKNDDKFVYDESNSSYLISKTYTGTLGTVPTGSKAIFDFTGTIFDTNYIQLYILNKDTSYFESAWIDNNLADMPKQVEIDSFSYGIEYDICEFDTIVVKYSQHINLSITPVLSFILNSDGTLTFNFRLYAENDLALGFTLLDYDISLKNENNFHNKEFKLFSQEQISGGATKDPDHFYLSGEELLLIPIRKGKEGYDFIHLINSDSTWDKTTKIASGNVILSSSNVLGMPINDIPPSVLAMALRNYSIESKEQPVGDIISARKWTGSGVECPLALVDLVSTDKYDAPSVLNSLDYIPINVAMSPQLFREYNVIGGTDFFNSFFDLLTNQYLTDNTYDSEGNLIHGGNTYEAEPLLYSPQFWQWVYLIDGSHRLVLTPDMIDFDKFIFKDWTVRLNVNMTDTTHYKLDISDINSETYPFTKSQSELISVDMITHPYSTEGFNNYMAYNQYTQETSKNAKDVQNYWAQKNLPIYQAGSIIGGLGNGIAGGAAGGGLWGAIAGGVGGLIGGVTEAITMKAGLENKISMVNELWDNQWNGTLSNYFSQPASLNPNGFGSGSLIYSNVKKSKSNQYETFRTFTITDIAKKEIWDDISINGYIFRSQCQYGDYDNRINFNIVNFNFDDRDSDVNKFLKERIGAISTLFAQQNFIDWYKLICKTGIRLFKKDLTVSNTQELIDSNIENDYVRPYIPLSGYAVCNYNLPKIDSDSEMDNPQVLTTNYSIVKSDTETNTYYLNKKNDKVRTYSVEIPLTYFGTKYYESDARAKFMNDFSGVRLNNDKSQESLFDKTTGKMFHSNIVDINYSKENILFEDLELVGDIYKTTKPIQYDVFSSDTDIYASLIKLQNPSGSEFVISNAYNNGWMVEVEIHTDKIVINASAFSKFRFISDKDITSWTVTKKLERATDLSSRLFDFSKVSGNIKRATAEHEIHVPEEPIETEYYGAFGYNIKTYDGKELQWRTGQESEFDILSEENACVDVIKNNFSKIGTNDDWTGICELEPIYMNKDYNNKIVLSLQDRIVISQNTHSEEQNVSLNKTFSYSTSEIESLKNREITFLNDTNNELSDSSKHPLGGSNATTAFRQYYKMTYDKDRDVFTIWRKDYFASEYFGDDDMTWVLSNTSVSRQSGFTPTFTKTIYVGAVESLAWSQENKLNSLIFPKTSLINEKSSYILSNKKK